MRKKKDVKEQKKANPVKLASGMLPLRSLFIVSVMCAPCEHALFLEDPRDRYAAGTRLRLFLCVIGSRHRGL